VRLLAAHTATVPSVRRMMVAAMSPPEVSGPVAGRLSTGGGGRVVTAAACSTVVVGPTDVVAGMVVVGSWGVELVVVGSDGGGVEAGVEVVVASPDVDVGGIVVVGGDVVVDVVEVVEVVDVLVVLHWYSRHAWAVPGARATATDRTIRAFLMDGSRSLGFGEYEEV
jgi:hypothetical protein